MEPHVPWAPISMALGRAACPLACPAPGVIIVVVGRPAPALARGAPTVHLGPCRRGCAPQDFIVPPVFHFQWCVPWGTIVRQARRLSKTPFARRATLALLRASPHPLAAVSALRAAGVIRAARKRTATVRALVKRAHLAALPPCALPPLVTLALRARFAQRVRAAPPPAQLGRTAVCKAFPATTALACAWQALTHQALASLLARSAPQARSALTRAALTLQTAPLAKMACMLPGVTGSPAAGARLATPLALLPHPQI